MRNHRMCLLFFVVVTAAAILSGCAGRDAFDNEASKRETLSPQPSVPTSPSSSSSIETQALSHTDIAETVVPLKSPSPSMRPTDDVIELLARVNRCDLPCWWGIQPGTTPWTTAEEIVAPYALEISSPIQITLEEVAYDVLIPVPPEVYPTRLLHRYVVEDGLVQRIEVTVGDVDGFQISELMEKLGQPKEVWVKTYSEAREGSLPFVTALYYPNMGVVAQYSGEAEEDGGYVVECPEDRFPSVNLVLTPPTQDVAFEEAVEDAILLGPTQLWKYQRLEEVSELDPQSFYERYRQPDNTSCIKTEAGNWPSP